MGRTYKGGGGQNLIWSPTANCRLSKEDVSFNLDSSVELCRLIQDLHAPLVRGRGSEVTKVSQSSQLNYIESYNQLPSIHCKDPVCVFSLGFTHDRHYVVLHTVRNPTKIIGPT